LRTFAAVCIIAPTEKDSTYRVQRAPRKIVPDCGWDQEEWAGVPSLAIAHTLTHIVDPEIGALPIEMNA
jgi:hypothetical protein